MSEDLGFLFALLLNGASIGLMYSLIALGFVLVYKATDAINFAQGEFVMLAGLIVAMMLSIEGMPLVVAVAVDAGRDDRLRLRAGARRAAAVARPARRRRDHGDHRPRGRPARPGSGDFRQRDAGRVACRSATSRSSSGRPVCRRSRSRARRGDRLLPGVQLVLQEEPHGRRHAGSGRQSAGGAGHGHQCRALLRAGLGDGRHRVGAGRHRLGQHAGGRRASGAGRAEGVSRW